MTDVELIECVSCGAKNRVPLAKVAAGARPKCGSCKQPLQVQVRPFAITDATFAQELERSDIPLLVDAWAAWCGPCRALAPIVDELAAEYEGRLRVAKLNVDENPVTAQRFDLRSIPTLLLFRGGREIERIVGAQPKAQLKQRIDRALGTQ